MPRGKRCLHDSGLHVPLLVRFPEWWAHLAPGRAGSSTDRLVSFVDFAPTVLSLCGVKAPGHFQGTAFLGPDSGAPREYIHGARDRVDEAFDVARSVRDGRWLYIRNFMAHLSWMQPEGYSDASTFRRELKRLAARGQLGPGPLTYAAARRALEELYDTEADPYQLRNLAGAPEQREIVDRMRVELRRWQFATRDAGFVTEPQMWDRVGDGGTPWSVARDESRYPLARLLESADAVGRVEASTRQREWLRDRDDGVRYWGAVGLNARLELEADDREALQNALRDSSSVVQVEAAAALARHQNLADALPVLTVALEDDSGDVRLHAARALELLGPAARPAQLAMEAALERGREAEARGDTIAMFLRFSLEAALQSGE
jgi:hypothetical protein